MAMQRIANPWISVRLRDPPPLFENTSCSARVVELVDTRDLKSLAGNSVPVQVRPRAPIPIISKSIKYREPLNLLAFKANSDYLCLQ